MNVYSKIPLYLLSAGLTFAIAAPALAACVSNDCSALGYTKSESYCDGDIIRCPFDTSKVFCKEGCRVANCAACSPSNPNYCSACYPGYSLEYGQCVIAPRMVNLTVCFKLDRCPSSDSQTCFGNHPSIYGSIRQGNINKSLTFGPAWNEEKCLSAEIDGNSPVTISYSAGRTTSNINYNRDDCIVAEPQISAGYGLNCQEQSLSGFWQVDSMTISAEFQPDPNALNNKVTIFYKTESAYNYCQNFYGRLDYQCRIQKSY